MARKAAFFDDLRLALALLQGRSVTKKGRPTIEYLSPSTKPTSREAQAALARLLAAFAKKLTKGATKGAIRNDPVRQSLAMILANLAQLFDARAPIDENLRLFFNMFEPTLRVAKITKLSKGHANPLDFWVALEVEQLIDAGRPKLKAYRAVAKNIASAKDE